jgi:peptidoglycan hydrolase CwlO-like protein
MSDDKVSLEFLGEQMQRMQTDLRGVRSEQTRQEGELQSLGSKVDALDSKVDVLDSKIDYVDAKVDRVEKKLDNFAASVDARFDQVHQTMATNLEVMLKAFDAGKR